MNLGQIVEPAGTEELFTAPRHPYTHSLLSAAPVADPKVERTRQRIVLRAMRTPALGTCCGHEDAPPYGGLRRGVGCLRGRAGGPRRRWPVAGGAATGRGRSPRAGPNRPRGPALQLVLLVLPRVVSPGRGSRPCSRPGSARRPCRCPRGPRRPRC
ncbi:ABC transporter ATP-binding protein [Nonomuraea aurantiaca]|uniref:ABC transporter ATP-binding protein n=1 Tax=Nonomuraea aurantiaca TaxID=2878562 RepID=UPI0027E058A6|nr:hypothetical protein [Nonomuraea aurantiaca]